MSCEDRKRMDEVRMRGQFSSLFCIHSLPSRVLEQYTRQVSESVTAVHSLLPCVPLRGTAVDITIFFQTQRPVRPRRRALKIKPQYLQEERRYVPGISFRFVRVWVGQLFVCVRLIYSRYLVFARKIEANNRVFYYCQIVGGGRFLVTKQTTHTF